VKIFDLVDRVYAQYNPAHRDRRTKPEDPGNHRGQPAAWPPVTPHVFNYITQVAIKPPAFALFVEIRAASIFPMSATLSIGSGKPSALLKCRSGCSSGVKRRTSHPKADQPNGNHPIENQK